MNTLEASRRDQAVATIRMLAVDGVEKANSGHPGTPMALAQICLEVWLRHLRYDPQQPAWPDRDRFVLSCGHASMLLYSMLHLSGYELTLDDLKAFRQWGSKTPGHPEIGVTPGVETTTGPLGQGISNAVGMALGLKMRAAKLGKPELVGARIFGICSDGDLMEGISGEASSIAGHLGLDNLVFFYDDNKITIDGSTDLSFSENVAQRYEAYGWKVWSIDGHDHAAIAKALDEAVAHRGQPKLIVARTVIGIGAPTKAGSHKAHGEPLGAAEIKGAKERLGVPADQTFYVPEEVRTLFAERAAEGVKTREAWEALVKEEKAKSADLAKLFDESLSTAVPSNILEELVKVAPRKEVATRVSSGLIEQRVAALVPSLVGGSADLNPSTKTMIEGSPAVQRGSYAGRNIHFGIREHAMGAVVNGLAMTEGFIPFGSTFLVFSDYMRPTIRIAALSHLHSLFIFTHDSLYLGEDGPTHQPVEQLWALRLIPNVDVVRPADDLECAGAWAHALLRSKGPTVFALTRQNLPALPRPSGFKNEDMLKGGYVIHEAESPRAVLIATGAEVSLAVAAAKLLATQGVAVRVVSMLCFEQFKRQDAAYQESVLPQGLTRVVVELGVTLPWQQLAGPSGLVVGHDGFGFSAPAPVIAKHLGFTPEALAERVSKHLG